MKKEANHWLAVAMLIFLSASQVFAQVGQSFGNPALLGDVRTNLSGGGAVGPVVPQNWFRFEVTDSVRAVTVTVDSGAVVDVAIVRDLLGDGIPDANLSSAGIFNGAGAKLSLWLGVGVYYVQIAQRASTSVNYHFTITSVAKNSRGEGDNDLARAVQLGNVTGITPVVEFVGISDAQDWYRFEVTGRVRSVSVTIAPGPILGLAVLRDLDRNGIADPALASANDFNGAGVTVSLWLDPGVYYVQVTSSGQNNEYQLGLASTPQFQSEGESDNNLLDAVNLGDVTKAPPIREFVGLSDGQDWFRFEVKDTVRMVTVGIAAGPVLRFNVIRDLDNDGIADPTLATYNIFNGAGGNISLWLDRGVYFVQVLSSGNNVEYQLGFGAVAKPQSDGATNNDYLHATDLKSGYGMPPIVDFIGAPDPQDWYRFEVSNTVRTVSITIAPGPVLTLSLRRAAASNGVPTAVGSVNIFNGAGGTLSNDLTPGVYFIQVSGGDNVEYQLGISQTLPAGTRPFVVAAPTGATIKEGEAILLKVSAAGSGILSYAWSRDNIPLDGKTAAQLSIAHATLADVGRYAVRISNEFGNVTTEPVEIAVSVVDGVTIAIEAAAVLSWSADRGAFILEGSDDLITWKEITTQPAMANGRFEVTVKTSEKAKNYQLKKAP